MLPARTPSHRLGPPLVSLLACAIATTLHAKPKPDETTAAGQASEQRFISDKITRNHNVIAWIGATDAHEEGDWVWIDGNPGYWPWNKGEPSNAGKAPQNHGVLKMIGTISDLAEDDNRVNAYLCEWDYPPTREEVYTWDRDEEAEEVDEDPESVTGRSIPGQSWVDASPRAVVA